nr:Cro/CI family transcriptional regulator [Cronobacter sakazakii]
MSSRSGHNRWSANISKAASDFGVIQCAISKAILAGRNIMVTVKPDGSVIGGGNKGIMGYPDTNHP